MPDVHRCRVMAAAYRGPRAPGVGDRLGAGPRGRRRPVRRRLSDSPAAPAPSTSLMKQTKASKVSLFQKTPP